MKGSAAKMCATGIGVGLIALVNIHCERSVVDLDQLAEIELAPQNLSLTIGESRDVVATGYDATAQEVPGLVFSWESEDESIAEVNSSGRVTGVDLGSTLITVSAGTSSATAEVTVYDPSDLALLSDWGTATGNSELAISDGGYWDRLVCTSSISDVLTVVDGSTVGWSRTPNVLRFQMRGSSDCAEVERWNALPESTTHWGRFYWRNDETQNINAHPVTYNCCGSIQLIPWARAGSSEGVLISLSTSGPYPTNAFWAGSIKADGALSRDRLPNDTWFRHEWMVEYVTPTTVRLWPRIYDMNGDLLYDADTYFQNDHPQSGSETLRSWYDAGNTISISDASLARHFGFGNEGPASSSASMEYWYIADAALSLEGWIGR